MSTSTYSSSVPTEVEEEEPMALSDLVRTGEASRLRRRGAITGHRANRQSSSSFAGAVGETLLNGTEYQWNRPPLAQIVVPPPPWTDVSPVNPPAVYPPWPDIPDPTKAEEEADGHHGSSYAIYCGYEDWEFGDEEPYEPSPLPEPFEAPTPSTRAPQRFRKSTGCGALIHTNGTPRTKNGTWQARGKAADVVVPLDKMYFERGGQPKQFACGCRWHGVGCSNCGNALGNIYMPCQAATATSSLTRDQSRASRAARQVVNSSAQYIYTFFFSAVNSSPAFEFPESAVVHAHGSRATIPSVSTASRTRDTAAQGWEGVSATVDESEYTYGYAEQEQEQEQEEPGAEYDPDGMLIVNEPGSPDKPSAEAMLWPAR
ncbi:hypothetical protein DFH11DRAFT_1691863 [Phellopilus nigrolimitatus]|nr:hypothetical protein DFH11DRAFT_1691863 [Phellopilus nigrolimitatus]